MRTNESDNYWVLVRWTNSNVQQESIFIGRMSFFFTVRFSFVCHVDRCVQLSSPFTFLYTHTPCGFMQRSPIGDDTDDNNMLLLKRARKKKKVKWNYNSSAIGLPEERSQQSASKRQIKLFFVGLSVARPDRKIKRIQVFTFYEHTHTQERGKCEHKHEHALLGCIVWSHHSIRSK